MPATLMSADSDCEAPSRLRSMENTDGSSVIPAPVAGEPVSS